MTSRKMGDLPRVEALAIDADTVRIGGDAFRRIRKCRIVRNKEDETWECDACGGAVGLAEVNYCENCGAKVERGSE